MKALFCKCFTLAALAMLVAVPAAADDVGLFRLEQDVLVGSAELPAGAYVFRATSRGLVLVYDEKATKVLAAVMTQRHELRLDELEMSGTLAHDWAVRSLSLGCWNYAFCLGTKPVAVASRSSVPRTVVALAR